MFDRSRSDNQTNALLPADACGSDAWPCFSCRHSTCGYFYFYFTFTMTPGCCFAPGRSCQK